MNLRASISSFNDWFASKITDGVSTMWCAYIFACISFSSLPSTLALHSVNSDVQWIAQTFLQLVLLSVIMVGQKVQASRTDALHDKVDTLHDKHDTLHALIGGKNGTSEQSG